MPQSFQFPAEIVGLAKSALPQIDEVQRRLNSTFSNFGRSNLPLGRITADAKDFDRSLAAATNRVAAFGATAGIYYGVERALRSLVSSTIDVENTFTKINVNLNLSKTGLQNFASQVFQIGRNTGQSFDQIAKGAEELSRQGLTTEETLKRLSDAAILSRRTGEDLDQTIKGLTATINEFSGEALTTGSILNKIVAVSSNFSISAKDLSSGIEGAGESASKAGVSLDKFIGLLTAAQQITQRSGSSLNSSFTRIFNALSNPTALRQIEESGIAVRNALTGNRLPSDQILSNIAQGYDKLSKSNQDMIERSLGGIYSINVLKATLGELAKQYNVVARATQISSSATDQATRGNDEFNKTLASSVNVIKSSTVQLFSNIGQSSIGPLGKAIGDVFGGTANALGPQGSKIGQTIGTGIIQGIANVLAGPALAIAGRLLAKLTVSIGSTVKGEVDSVLKLNGEQKQRVQIEEQIAKILNRQNESERLSLLNATSMAEKQKIILATAERLAATTAISSAGLSAESFMVRAPGLRGVLGGKAPNPGLNLAGGYIASEKSAIAGGVGGAPSSASPVIIPNFHFGRGKRGTVVANSSEYLIPNFNGGDAIFNRQMTSSFGVPNGAISLAGGFVPNFLPTNLLRAFRKALNASVSFTGGLRSNGSGALGVQNENGISLNLSLLGNQRLLGGVYEHETIHQIISNGGYRDRLKGLSNEIFEGFPESSTTKARFRANQGFYGRERLAEESLADFPFYDTFEKYMVGNELGFPARSIQSLDRIHQRLSRLLKARISPIMDAVRRESAAGVPLSEIYVDRSDRLKSADNPFGFLVANRRDEPLGGAQGISRVLNEGGNPMVAGAAKGIVPNFAADDLTGGLLLRSKSGKFVGKDVYEKINELLLGFEQFSNSLKNSFGKTALTPANRQNLINKLLQAETAKINASVSELGLSQHSFGQVSQIIQNPSKARKEQQAATTIAKIQNEKLFRDIESSIASGNVLTPQQIRSLNQMARKRVLSSAEFEGISSADIKSNPTFSRLYDIRRQEIVGNIRSRNAVNIAVNERTVRIEQEAREREMEKRQQNEKNLREQRINSRVLAASFIAPFAAGFLPQGAGGTTSGITLGGLRGAAQGAGIGGVFGPLGLAIGAGVGGLVGAFEKATRSVADFQAQFDIINQKSQERLQGIQQVIQIQQQLHDALASGESPGVIAQLQQQGQLAQNALSPAVQKELEAARGDIEKMTEIFLKAQTEDARQKARGAAITQTVAPISGEGIYERLIRLLVNTGSAPNSGPDRVSPFLFGKIPYLSAQEQTSLGGALSSLLNKNFIVGSDVGRLARIGEKSGESASQRDIAFVQSYVAQLNKLNPNLKLPEATQFTAGGIANAIIFAMQKFQETNAGGEKQQAQLRQQQSFILDLSKLVRDAQLSGAVLKARLSGETERGKLTGQYGLQIAALGQNPFQQINAATAQTIVEARNESKAAAQENIANALPSILEKIRNSSNNFNAQDQKDLTNAVKNLDLNGIAKLVSSTRGVNPTQSLTILDDINHVLTQNAGLSEKLSQDIKTANLNASLKSQGLLIEGNQRAFQNVNVYSPSATTAAYGRSLSDRAYFQGSQLSRQLSIDQELKFYEDQQKNGGFLTPALAKRVESLKEQRGLLGIESELDTFVKARRLSYLSPRNRDQTFNTQSALYAARQLESLGGRTGAAGEYFLTNIERYLPSFKKSLESNLGITGPNAQTAATNGAQIKDLDALLVKVAAIPKTVTTVVQSTVKVIGDFYNEDSRRQLGDIITQTVERVLKEKTGKFPAPPKAQPKGTPALANNVGF